MAVDIREFDDFLKRLARSGDVRAIAAAENFLFDERVSADRRGEYLSALSTLPEDHASWDERHRDVWVRPRLFRPLPETFTAVNAQAAHSAGLDGDQYLLRIEDLSHALGALGSVLVDELATVLQVHRTGRADGKYGPDDAGDLLWMVCESLNSTTPHAARPRFAGFEAEVEEGLPEGDGWAIWLRDRFGLGHYDPGNGGPIPVALMRYRVDEVRAPAVPHPVCVPTVLDAELNPYFMPAPRELPYGRTLNLDGDPNCERKIAEVLHMKVEYTPNHLYKIGVVDQPPPAHTLGKLREEHLFCLQYDSNRADFGKLDGP